MSQGRVARKALAGGEPLEPWILLPDTLRYIVEGDAVDRPVREFEEVVGHFPYHVVELQARQPFRRDGVDSVHRTEQVAGDGRGGIRVATVIYREQDPLPEVVGDQRAIQCDAQCFLGDPAGTQLGNGFWRSPEKYFRKFRGFAGVICPDHSTYRNLPRAQQIDNTVRNQLLGARMQADGYDVIPNVRLNGRDSVPYALAGVPLHSTLALGLHGCTKSRENRPHVIEEIRIICDLCQPANLVVYGSDAYDVLNYPLALDIPVHVYAADSFRRSAFREAS